MNFKTILITVLTSALISILTLFIYRLNFTSRTAYIDIRKVFDNFQMKAELEGKYRQTQKERTKILDSLSINLKVMSKHLQEQEVQKRSPSQDEIYQFEYMRERYLKLREQFEEDNTSLTQKYDSQILTQLTQYVTEYGRLKGYDYIFGADGNGSLMYSKESLDISAEVILFINNKYKGID
jgi:outer membrane protein